MVQRMTSHPDADGHTGQLLRGLGLAALEKAVGLQTWIRDGG